MSSEQRETNNAATVLALLHRVGRPVSLKSLLAGWDMLQADIPSREDVEAGCSILVGSGLASVSDDWRVDLTREGERIRRSVSSWSGMRVVRAELADRLTLHDLARSPLQLPPDMFERALRE